MRNSKGFTLVELAVVLVIIGIILGAVIKGNDLIENASQKAILQIPAKWETPIWSYYDKKGKLPGSTAGLITWATLKTDLTAEGISYPSDDAVGGVTVTSIGSVAKVCAATDDPTRNVMILANVPLSYAKKLDANIDGAADGTKGRIRRCGADATTTAKDWDAATVDDPVSVTYFFDKTIP